MADNIFRKKSLDRVSSPEQLNDYVKVANPGVWTLLVGIIFLLVGICIWGIWGRLDSKLTVGVISDEDKTICFIPEDKIDKISEGSKIIVNGTEGSIINISSSPVEFTDDDSYVAHIANLKSGQWVYIAVSDIKLKNGAYKGEIIIESISPKVFVIN